MNTDRAEREFPISAGILFGLGLGGFFDGIILHQVLQWHHMLTSNGYPPNSIHNLEVNTLWDGLFSHDYLRIRFIGAHYPVEESTSNACSMVWQASNGNDFTGIWYLQRSRGHH
jgi:uncharacterized membrane protein